MPDDRLARVVEMFRSRGNIGDDVQGDVRVTARAWLERAREELAVLEPILAAGQWRVAYNTAYDIYRHAAEAVDLAAGYRILASAGPTAPRSRSRTRCSAMPATCSTACTPAS
jgi:hypothetical protein